MSLLLTALSDAGRQLRRSPGFSCLAVGLLAIGLGATIAIFSLAHAIVLRPLPFRDPRALVGFEAINATKSVTQEGHSASDFRDIATRATLFAALGACRPNFAAYTQPGQPSLRFVTALVTEQFFEVLGVAPALGRSPRPEEFSAAAERVVLLSDRAWRRHFAADPQVIGRIIILDEQPHTVVGVMGPEFREPEFVDAWLPFPREAPEYFARDSRFWSVVGRLRPGTALGQAQAELRAITADLARENPDTNRDWSSRVVPLQELRTRGMRRALGLLTGAVSLVLLITCLNLANLLLARGLGRQSELALRMAVGARPAQLAGGVLLESTLLALLGGLIGCGLAALGLHALVNALPAGLVPRSHEIAIHPPALAFAFAASLVTGVFFGALPAWQILGTDFNALLKEGGTRGSSARFTGRMQSLLVPGQVAMSFVVLATSLLLMKSLVRLQNVDPGFDTTDVLTLQLAPPTGRYETNLELAQYYERLIDEVRSVPGVASAAVNASAPLCGINLQFPFWVYGRPRSEVTADEAIYAPVSEDFFATLKLPLRAGRTFTVHDNEAGPPVAVINQALARRMFPGENPIGHRVLLLPWLSSEYREIVGVVADSRQASLASPPPAQIYVPQRQMPWFFSTLLIRLARPDAVRAVQAALNRADPNLPFAPDTLESKVALTTTQPRLYSALFAGFAVIAVALAAFGLYASMSFTTCRRTQEFGIRLALGSTPAQILQLVLHSGVRLAAWGVIPGLAVALAVSRLLQGVWYGVEPMDVWAYAAPLLLLPLIALAAAAPPGIRAARLPVIRALQHE